MVGSNRVLYRLLIGTLALVLVTVCLVALVFVKLSDTNTTLRLDVNAQVTNRAANVRSWCDGINEARDYDRAFVRAVTHGKVAYRLRDLPCRALVDKTLKSAQH